MLEIPIFDAIVWSIVGLSAYTIIITPLVIRYMTPNKEEN